MDPQRVKLAKTLATTKLKRSLSSSGHDIAVLISGQEFHDQDGQSKSSDHIHHLSRHLVKAMQPTSGRNVLDRNS